MKLFCTTHFQTQNLQSNYMNRTEYTLKSLPKRYNMKMRSPSMGCYRNGVQNMRKNMKIATLLVDYDRKYKSQPYKKKREEYIYYLEVFINSFMELRHFCLLFTKEVSKMTTFTSKMTTFVAPNGNLSNLTQPNFQNQL